jgi:ferritin heavy chain
MSLAKQNFASQSEEALNQQVNTELQASQVYLSMSAWAQHSSVALPGLEKYFRESAEEVSFSSNCFRYLTPLFLGKRTCSKINWLVFIKTKKKNLTDNILILDYINTRGGRVVLRALQAPETDWKSAKNAVESALQLEKGKQTSNK